MVNVYINYPHKRFIIHTNPKCPALRQHQKEKQRIVKINIETISQELQKFIDKKVEFGSDAKFNDMWINVNFNDKIFEEAVIRYINRLIAMRYSLLENIDTCQLCKEKKQNF